MKIAPLVVSLLFAGSVATAEPASRPSEKRMRIDVDVDVDGDEDAASDQEGQELQGPESQERQGRSHRHYHWREHSEEMQSQGNRFAGNVFKGFGLNLLGGATLRTRNDLGRIAQQLGPAGDPSRLSGVFTAQAFIQLTRYARLAVDLTLTGFSAEGRGPDKGGIDVRQVVDYRFITGAIGVDGVLPVSKRVDLALELALGAGVLRASSFTTRIETFSQVGADLRAIAKTERFTVSAPVIQVKPALDLRIKFSRHVALDLRGGVTAYYVMRNSLVLEENLTLSGSPELFELHPFGMVGVTFGAWQFDKGSKGDEAAPAEKAGK